MLATPNSLSKLLSIAALVVVAGAPGCNRDSGSEEPFTMSMLETEQVNIRVETAAGPLSRAVVSIWATVPEVDYVPQGTQERLFRAITGEDGVVTGPLVRPSAVGQLDVVVHKAGFLGPYSDEKRLEVLGIFAPASWQAVGPKDVADMTITLRALEVSQ